MLMFDRLAHYMFIQTWSTPAHRYKEQKGSSTSLLEMWQFSAVEYSSSLLYKRFCLIKTFLCVFWASSELLVSETAEYLEIWMCFWCLNISLSDKWFFLTNWNIIKTCSLPNGSHGLVWLLYWGFWTQSKYWGEIIYAHECFTFLKETNFTFIFINIIWFRWVLVY